MFISTTKISNQVSRAQKSMPSKQSLVTDGPKDSTTFSFTDNKAFREATATATYLGGAAGAVGTGMYAANFLPSGMSGFGGAVTGVLTGAAAGGAAGYALAAGSNALWPSDRAGEGMMKGLITSAGVLVGAVAGGLSGYFGAQPLLVGPAALAGGAVTTLALGVARDAVLR